MFEFEIRNKVTSEIELAWGCSENDMYRRTNLDPNVWQVTCAEYID